MTIVALFNYARYGSAIMIATVTLPEYSLIGAGAYMIRQDIV